MNHNESTIVEVAKELVAQEQALMHAEEIMERASTLYRLAAKRYAAVRDMVAEMLGGKSPYSASFGLDVQLLLSEETPNFGHYRYLFKAVGDAVYEALEDAPEPLSIQDVVTALRHGGLPTDARAVNASLLNMRGVHKSPDGLYSLAQSEGDLPF